MDTKYTAGPWRLVDSSDNRSKGYIRPCGPNAIREDGSRPAICRIVHEGHSADERRANTRLIEAAPELLEAVKLLLASVHVSHPVGYTIDNALDVFSALRSAVAHAELSNRNT